MGFFNLFRKKKEKKSISEEAGITDEELTQKIREKFDIIDFGILGTISSDKFNVYFSLDDLNYELNCSFDEQQAVDYVISKLQWWQKTINEHKYFFANYFLHCMILFTAGTDSHFWEGYIIDENQYDDAKCSQIFDSIMTPEFEESLEIYTNKDTKLYLGDLIKEEFAFFDFDKFMKGIKLEYITFALRNELAIQLSDEKYSAFCGAYENFSENLEGLDYHNF